MIDLITKLVALAGSLSLIASLVFDWGFLHALDISFLRVPSTIGDHIRSALLWLPKVATAIAVIFVFEMFTRRIERGMSEEELVHSSTNPVRTKRLRDSPLWLFGSIAMLVILGYVLLGDPFLPGLNVSLCIAWFLFSAWAQGHPRILARRPYSQRVIAHYLPPALIWLFMAGYLEAVSLSSLSATRVLLTESTTKDESVVVLRHLERGVLVKDSSETIGFRPWSEVKRLSALGKYTPSKGLLCGHFNVGCMSKSASSP